MFNLREMREDDTHYISVCRLDQLFRLFGVRESVDVWALQPDVPLKLPTNALSVVFAGLQKSIFTPFR
jgi:hypothetical protein